GDQRVTAVGRALRATKLDELPELINILRGEMSFVGPRPEVEAFVDLEDPRWRRVLEARPGLTDPVTLRLRSEEALLAELRRSEPASSTEDLYRRYLQPFKLRGYLDYLEARSAPGDLAILLATARAVLALAAADPPTLEELRAAAESLSSSLSSPP
ncbi:MAG: sugar transferase, partial [Acidobacteriota bacterium]